jgi:hypothetical protein
VLRTLGHVAMTVKVRVGLWRLRRSKTALLKEKLPSIAAADAPPNIFIIRRFFPLSEIIPV